MEIYGRFILTDIACNKLGWILRLHYQGSAVRDIDTIYTFKTRHIWEYYPRGDIAN